MGEKPTFKDIVELAKAGYKPGEVKELIEAASKLDVAKPEEEPAENLPKEEPQPEQEKQEQEEPVKVAESNEVIDQLKQQVKELTEKLQTLQEANTKKDLQGTVKSDQEKLDEIARSFM